MNVCNITPDNFGDIQITSFNHSPIGEEKDGNTVNGSEKDGNTAIVTYGSKTKSLISIDNDSKKIEWRSGCNDTDVEDSPIVPFKKSSNKMSRHAIKCMVPMAFEAANRKTYNHSDGGRRKKVVNIRTFGDLGYSTDESSEYESPDEDWYYDPRRTSKWTWANDYSSVTSHISSESTIENTVDYESCREKHETGK
jgi:hypothetical protein